MLAIEKKIRFYGAKVLEIAFYFFKITLKTVTYVRAVDRYVLLAIFFFPEPFVSYMFTSY